MKPTNLLVTGCAGFIGSNLCRSLLHQGHTVTGIDNFDPYYPRQVKEQNIAPFFEHPGFTFFETDLTDKNTLNLLPRKLQPEVVVHLAAKVGVRSSFEDPEGYANANLFGTECLLKWMQQRDIHKLVFASSSSVYGKTAQMPFVETAELPSPLSPYAASKIACERLNLTHHQQHGLEVINLRFFTVYGPGQRSDLAIHQFLAAMLQGKEIRLYGDGTSTRDYTYIDDLNTGIESAIDYQLANEKVFETINLGSGRPIALTEMIDILGEESGCKPRLVHLPPQPGDMENTFASIEKAGKLLGYLPQMTFREGIRKFIRWFEKKRYEASIKPDLKHHHLRRITGAYRRTPGAKP